MTAAHAAAPAQAVRGLAVAADDLRVVVEQPELRRGRTEQLRFRIVDERGETVRDFDVEHEKRMHLILARRDLTGFQHLHPTQGADGTWSAPVRLDDAGSYRLFADFSHEDTPQTLASDLRVDGAADLEPLPAPQPTAVSDGGYDVRLDAGAPSGTLRFTITRDGKPVKTEPYLGAGGHLVALREGDMAFLHVHPTGDGPRFAVDVPDRGPLPPVPPVPARGPRPDGRLHAGGQVAMALELPITGMTCASCANRIERKLNKLDGVTASVNYATEKATVDFDPDAVTPDDLVAAVEAAGYQAVLPSDEPAGDETEADELAPLRRRLIISALLSLPVLLIAMIRPLQFDNWQWLCLQLATPVILWGAWPFHRAAWANLKHGTATMDTLISMGVLAAWGWSLYALFLGDAGMPDMRMSFDLIPDSAGSGADEIYLEVGAVVTTFLLAGRYFEARAKRRAGAALKALLELGAKDVELADGRAACRSSSSRSATASSSAPARRSPPTASSSRARARSTSRCSPASPCRSRSSPATRSPARPSTPAAASSCAPPRSAATPRSPRSRGSSPTPSPARRRSSASPTASRASSSRS